MLHCPYILVKCLIVSPILCDDDDDDDDAPGYYDTSAVLVSEVRYE